MALKDTDLAKHRHDTRGGFRTGAQDLGMPLRFLGQDEPDQLGPARDLRRRHPLDLLLLRSHPAGTEG